MNNPKTNLPAGLHIQSDGHLTCPVCGFEYTHIKEVYTRRGNDPYEPESGAYPGTVTKDIGDERRSALVIVFHCEELHKFELVIQQHKGFNHLYLNNKGPAYPPGVCPGPEEDIKVFNALDTLFA